jgi:hypothetical protein
MDRTYVSGIERGVRSPSLDMKLAKALGYSFEVSRKVSPKKARPPAMRLTEAKAL